MKHTRKNKNQGKTSSKDPLRLYEADWNCHLYPCMLCCKRMGVTPKKQSNFRRVFRQSI